MRGSGKVNFPGGGGGSTENFACPESGGEGGSDRGFFSVTLLCELMKLNFQGNLHMGRLFG